MIWLFAGSKFLEELLLILGLGLGAAKRLNQFVC